MDVPFLIFALYTAIALIIGLVGIVMGIKKIAGSPFITVIAGLMFLLQVIMIENIEMGYTDERSILVSSINIAGQDGVNVTTTHMNVTSGGNDTPLSNTIIRNGALVTAGSALVGDTFNTIDVYLKKVNSPTGSITMTFRDNIDSVIATSNNIVDASILTTSYVKHTFTFTDDVTITSGGRILLECSCGASPNSVNIERTGSDGFDGVNTHLTFRSGGSYTDSNTSLDIKMIVYHIVETTTSDTHTINTYDSVGNQPIEYAFNEYDIWVFTILLGMMFMFIGIMLQYQTWGKT